MNKMILFCSVFYLKPKNNKKLYVKKRRGKEKILS
jgi:hypothetical protein